jgi:hypothetical protein
MRTTTMKTIIIMIAIITFFEIPSFASDYRDLTHMNYEWYINNYKKIDQIIVSGTNDEAIPVINVLGLIWKNRDGGIWIEVAPAIGGAILHKTKLMLLWFAGYPEEYSSWLDKMPRALFTAWSGKESDVVRLETLRTKMIEHLKTYQNSEANEDLRQKSLALIEVLQKTKVRKIE